MTAPVQPHHATSPDGTPVSWLSLGTGPDLVIVHGAMQSARSQLDLAQLLAPTHTVHLMQRRGRGRSGPYPPSGPYTPIEVDDLATVLAATGARDVLGISSGALIALRAALREPDLDRVAAFEPPLAVTGSVRLDQIDRFNQELARGDLPDAMITAMRTAEMGPALMRNAPRPLLRAMTTRMLNPKPNPGPDAQPGEVSVRELAQALRVDLAIVAENADHLDDFAAIAIPTILIDGTKTRPYLRTAVQALARTIPGARRVSLNGTNHAVTQNRKDWGRPDRIGPTLLDVFSAPTNRPL